MKAVDEYKVKELLIAGGVSANTGIRDEFDKLCKEKNIKLVVPNINYCTDNGAMIAAAGYYYYKKGLFSDFSLKTDPSLDL